MLVIAPVFEEPQHLSARENAGTHVDRRRTNGHMTLILTHRFASAQADPSRASALFELGPGEAKQIAAP